jgi:hypothetical protein
MAAEIAMRRYVRFAAIKVGSVSGENILIAALTWAKLQFCLRNRPNFLRPTSNILKMPPNSGINGGGFSACFGTQSLNLNSSYYLHPVAC